MACRLMTSGRVGAAAVWRGMAVAEALGEVVGMVAGVVVDCADDRATHILLGRVPPTDDYRLVPVEALELVGGAGIRLRLAAAEVEALPRHIPD